MNCLLCGELMDTLASEKHHGKRPGQCSEIRVGDLVTNNRSKVHDEVITTHPAGYTLRTPVGRYYLCPSPDYLTKVPA